MSRKSSAFKKFLRSKRTFAEEEEERRNQQQGRVFLLRPDLRDREGMGVKKQETHQELDLKTGKPFNKFRLFSFLDSRITKRKKD